MTGALLHRDKSQMTGANSDRKVFFLSYRPALLSSSSSCQYLLGLQASRKMEGETTVSLKMLTVLCNNPYVQPPNRMITFCRTLSFHSNTFS